MIKVEALINHCENVVKQNWKYVFGAKGKILDKNEIIKLQERWGKDLVYDSDLDKAGNICCDCSWLISSCTGRIRNTYGYMETATEVKDISERNPEMKGWGVWKKGHIGVYDGNDGYYAMDGSENNAVHRHLSKNNFTHIIKLCDINYD